MTTKSSFALAWRLIAAVAVLGTASGCVSSRYLKAPDKTPPPQALNLAFAPGRIDGVVNTVITYNGPGSWKRNAFWDEYVVTVRNPGPAPVTIQGATLVDLLEAPLGPGDEPWSLEKRSKSLEQRYRDLGVAFVRYTAPAVLITAAGVAGVAGAGIFSAAGEAIATATLVAIPVYYISVVSINLHNKKLIESEFRRRLLTLPLTLAPGESRTASLFFPMIPSPRRLVLDWTSGPDRGSAVVDLAALHRLHLKETNPPKPPGTKP